MSHDHHDETLPEYKQIVPFTLIACALFGWGSYAITQSGLASRAISELNQSEGYEHVDITFKGTEAVLSGNVGTAQLKDHAAELVTHLPGVTGLAENGIEIGLPPPSEEALVHAKVSQDEHAHPEKTETPPALQAGAKPEQHASTSLPPADTKKHNAHAAPPPVEVPPAATENPFATLLLQDPAHRLVITANVTARNGDVEAVTKAQQQVDQIKANIIAGGKISTERVSTSINAQFSSGHQKARTTLSYIIE